MKTDSAPCAALKLTDSKRPWKTDWDKKSVNELAWSWDVRGACLWITVSLESFFWLTTLVWNSPIKWSQTYLVFVLTLNLTQRRPNELFITIIFLVSTRTWFVPAKSFIPLFPRRTLLWIFSLFTFVFPVGWRALVRCCACLLWGWVLNQVICQACSCLGDLRSLSCSPALSSCLQNNPRSQPRPVSQLRLTV